MTFDESIVGIGPNEFSCELTFVALSRVRKVTGPMFVISPSFLREQFFKIKSGRVRELKHEDPQ